MQKKVQLEKSNNRKFINLSPKFRLHVIGKVAAADESQASTAAAIYSLKP